jgi:ComF family protein
LPAKVPPAVQTQGRICRRCAAEPPSFRRARACFVYEQAGGEDRSLAGGTVDGSDAGRAAILAWKYRGDHALGRALANHLRDEFPFAGEHYDLCVPVPLHPARFRARGFNQAALLARSVAPGVGEFAPDTLRRLRATRSQTTLLRDARAHNVGGAFVLGPTARVAGRSILLVDDVLTSGATARACADVLLQGGARFVDVVALARASWPHADRAMLIERR